MLTQIQLLSGRLFPHLHGVLARQFPQALWSGSAAHPQIALTFDDGPHPRDTAHLLATLARHQVVATFFWLGVNIREHPALVRAAAIAGHQLAIHGYVHRPFPTTPAPQLRRQLLLTQVLLAALSGCPLAHLRDIRPPFGLFTPRTLTRLERWNFRPVMWSSVPLHWLQSGAATAQQVREEVRPGSLLVLHEGQRHGPPVAELLDAIIPQLKQADLRFVTVDQLWQAPGRD